MAYVNLAVGAIKFGSALMQGRSDRMNGNTQAMSMDYEADQEEQAAEQQAAIIRRARDYSVARATAAYAASGVRVDNGSATEVTNEINAQGTHDAYTAILNGQRAANKERAQAKIVAAGGRIQSAQDDLHGMGSALASGYQGYEGWVTANPKMAGGGGYNPGAGGFGYKNGVGGF